MKRVSIVMASALLVGSLWAAHVLAGPAVTRGVQETSNLQFQPKTITIHKGDTVKWTNTSNGIHHTTTSNTGLWNSKDMAPGATFKHRFTSVGTFRYHCKYHRQSGMVGKVVVQP